MPPQAENNKSLPDREATSAKEALEKVQQILASSNKEHLAKALAGEAKRPASARAMSRYSYYKERFALEFKAVLDEMMAEHKQGIHEDRIYNYKDFENELNPNSLYLKISQSKLFLLDKMDVEGKYAKFCELLSIERERGKGIRLFYNRDIIKGSSFRPTKVIDKEETNTWKDKIDSFLENSVKGEELHIEKLSLTPEQVQELEASFYPLDNVISKITHKSIFLAKI